MADHEDWTAGDEAQLRGALATLRTDVDTTPLPDVRFVKARGVRRRRQRALTLTAAAAAAAAVVGAVGYGQLGRDSTLPVVPATQTTGSTPTTPPTTTPTDSLDKPGALPLVQEWARTLGLPSSVLLTPVKPFDAVECLSAEPGTKVQQEGITLRSGSFNGGQVRFDVGENTDVSTAAKGVVRDLEACQQGPGFAVTKVSSTAYVQLFSYTAGDAGSGWFAVIAEQPQLVVLSISEPKDAATDVTRAQVAALADVAAKRLLRLGQASGSSSTSTSPASIGPTGSTKALSEDMAVAGPQPGPSSPLFVAASQWRAQALSGGATTTAGPGALEGSTATASCETDQQQAGIGGRIGVVSVMAGTGASSYVGRQRVQLDESSTADVQQSYVDARLAEAKALYGKGCRFGSGTVKSTAGPSQGTYRLDTVFTDGSPTFTEWVGVTAQKTPGAVSTVVITKMSDPGQGFAELDRLLMLARQK